MSQVGYYEKAYCCVGTVRIGHGADSLEPIRVCLDPGAFLSPAGSVKKGGASGADFGIEVVKWPG